MNDYRAVLADEFLSWHPALRQMRAVCERWLERNEPRGWGVLAALAVLNGKPSFRRGGADDRR